MTNDNRDETQNQLEDVAPNGKARPWQEKKLKTLELFESYKRIGLKNKAYRVAECGSYLEFVRSKDNRLRLQNARFCQVRLCPMCAWRRSLKIYAQTSKVMDKALEDKDYRFLFLTLTCRNVEAGDLVETIDKLFKAFNLLTKRKPFKNAVLGWFRGLEVTHNLTEDTYHPHFHVILMVSSSYFKKKSAYIKQEQWTSMWQSCLKADYTPIVDIRAFKTQNKAQTKKSVCETAKYTVKDNDYLISENTEFTDASVSILDLALANRRLVAFGGILKQIHKDLNLDDMEDGDLVHTDTDEEIRADMNEMVETYRWHIGYKQYFKQP